MKDKFTHLHVHSHYSLLDGLAKVDDIIKKAQSILVWAILITFVVSALLIMMGYIRRGVMGGYRNAGDAFSEGEQSAW